MKKFITKCCNRKVQKHSFFAFLLMSVVFSTGCKTETLFQTNFSSTTIGQPPAHNQQVGTANTDGPAGSVKVIASPVTTGGKWVEVMRLANQTSVSGLQGNFSKFIGDGDYTFSATLFIPAGSGLVTIQFEPFNQSVGTLTNFLHIDFMQDGQIRIDDNDATKFGSFPHNQAFLVQVTLHIDATAPTAHIVLAGAGTSGTADYTVLPPFRSIAHQFGAVRLWMGFPWTGTFDATNIVVTHRLN